MPNAPIQFHYFDCALSTQDEVKARLALVPAGTFVAVQSRRQRAGRGRGGRLWENPPKGSTGLLLSVGYAHTSLDRLSNLPQRVGKSILALFDSPKISWKAPNDFVVTTDTTKVGGVLIDAKTIGNKAVVIVGLGLNLTGPCFKLSDGRSCSTLEAVGVRICADDCVKTIAGLLSGD